MTFRHVWCRGVLPTVRVLDRVMTGLATILLTLYAVTYFGAAFTWWPAPSREIDLALLGLLCVFALPKPSAMKETP